MGSRPSRKDGCFSCRDMRYDAKRMATLQLANTDARLVYLALQYHLGRPGSELDPEREGQSDAALAEVASALEPQLGQALAEIELSDEQQRRLLSAVSGSINELKAAPLLESGGGNMLPAFKKTLDRLFPEVAEDPEEALPLAGHMLQLKRRLQSQSTTDREPEATSGAPWWQFWRRG